MAGRSPKTSSVLALDFGASSLKFAEMRPADLQILSAGSLPLEPADRRDPESVSAAIREILAQASAFSGSGDALIVSLPLCHGFARVIDVAEGAEDPVAALRWDMEQYLARPLNLYALDSQPLESREDAGPRYLAAAYRLGEIENLRDALRAAGAPGPAALDLDALSVVNAFAANYPECVPERTLILQVDARAASLFRTQHGEYLGGEIRFETGAADAASRPAGPQERAERLLRRARELATAAGEALGEWTHAERIFLCGELAGDADFRELLKTVMKAPYALLNPFRRVPGPNPEDHPHAYPGAPFAGVVGLALRLAAQRTPQNTEAAPMLRLNLLRDLPAAARTPQAAPKAPRARRETPPANAGKRALVAALLLLLAVAAGLFIRDPARVRGAVNGWFATAPSAASLHRSLEREASGVIAAQQSAAIAWLSAMEGMLPADSARLDSAFPGVTLTQAAFTASGNFTLRGNARGPEDLSRLQESLVLAPGIEVRDSRAQTLDSAKGSLDFTFAGGFAAPAVDSLPSPRVPTRAALDEELRTFLESAAAAGIEFLSLPAAAPTTSGTLQAHPFRLSATFNSARLSSFLTGQRAQGSPFGIRRISVTTSHDTRMLFLDIMAFSH